MRERRPLAAQSLRQKVYIVLAIIAVHLGLVQLFVVLSDAQAPEMIEHVDYYDISTFDEAGNPMLVEDSMEPPVVGSTAAEPEATQEYEDAAIGTSVAAGR